MGVGVWVAVFPAVVMLRVATGVLVAAAALGVRCVETSGLLSVLLMVLVTLTVPGSCGAGVTGMMSVCPS